MSRYEVVSKVFFGFGNMEVVGNFDKSIFSKVG